ncbi:MAG TPA: hypothetical protein VMU08_07570 [Rhizomicrobium sp.]|nr:hypothetical protein [Rhizomicrobium sp.]
MTAMPHFYAADYRPYPARRRARIRRIWRDATLAFLAAAVVAAWLLPAIPASGANPSLHAVSRSAR